MKELLQEREKGRKKRNQYVLIDKRKNKVKKEPKN